MQHNETVKLKGAEIQGLKIELLSENKGSTFRVNVTDDGGYRRTRVFVEYAEASAMFNSYLEGN